MNKILLISVFTIFNIMSWHKRKIVQTAGRAQLGEFAPNLQNSTTMSFSVRVWSHTDKLGMRDT